MICASCHKLELISGAYRNGGDNSHREHARRLHEEECKTNSGNRICLFEHEVNRGLADSRNQNGDSKSVQDRRVEVRGQQEDDNCRVNRKVLDAVQVGTHGTEIPLAALHFISALDCSSTGQNAGPAVYADRCNQRQQRPRCKAEQNPDRDRHESLLQVDALPRVRYSLLTLASFWGGGGRAGFRARGPFA
jgi:hypothetical protein